MLCVIIVWLKMHLANNTALFLDLLSHLDRAWKGFTQEDIPEGVHVMSAHHQLTLISISNRWNFQDSIHICLPQQWQLSCCYVNDHGKFPSFLYAHCTKIIRVGSVFFTFRALSDVGLPRQIPSSSRSRAIVYIAKFGKMLQMKDTIISSISPIFLQMWYHYAQHTYHHHMSLVSAWYHQSQEHLLIWIC